MKACSLAAFVVLTPEELMVDGWNVICVEELLVVTTGRVVLEEMDVEPPPGLTVGVPSGPEQLGAPLLLVTQVSPVAAENHQRPTQVSMRKLETYDSNS